MLDYRLETVTPPTTEPLTVAEVKKHVKLDAAYGEPAPVAPTAALISPAVAGNVDNGAHRYCVTYVTADGETDAGTVTAAVTVADKTVNGKVALSAIPTGGGLVTSRKLYRTATGGSTYLLLATLADNTTTTYTDNIADSALGAGVPTTNTTEDAELTRMIQTAREDAESTLNRALITQTIRANFDQFPDARWITLPRPPLQSVDSVKYVDEDGTLQTLDAGEYSVDTSGVLGRVILAYNSYWPSIRSEPKAVRVEFVTGYGSRGDVPARFREWMLARIMDRYAIRSSVVPEGAMSATPFVDSLVTGERLAL